MQRCCNRLSASLPSNSRNISHSNLSRKAGRSRHALSQPNFFGQVKPGTDLAYFPAGGHFSRRFCCPVALPFTTRRGKWCTGPIPWPTSREVGLRQSRRQPGLRLGNGGRPVRVTRAQAASAAESVQPVPWVFLVCTRGAVNRCSPSRVKSQSGLSASSRWPPFINTAPQPSASSARPCSSIFARSLRAWGHRVARPLPAGSG